MLHSQLAWFVGGPLLGLCVVAMRWLMNERLGVMGAWTDVVDTVAAKRLSFGPFGWMLVGLIAGGAAFALIAGGPDFHGYGWLTDTFSSGAGRVVIAAILLGAGVLIGFGAKTAGGCTSGNGLTGTSLLSRAAWVATATFFGTAIVVSFAIKGLT